jgi:hypothetical protein
MRATSRRWGSRRRPDLNAYIPLLSVGLLSRYTELVDLAASWDKLEDPLVLGIVGVVGLADFIGDKVTIVDHVLPLIGLAVAPIVGGLLIRDRDQLRHRPRSDGWPGRGGSAGHAGRADRHSPRLDGDDDLGAATPS